MVIFLYISIVDFTAVVAGVKVDTQIKQLDVWFFWENNVENIITKIYQLILLVKWSV